MIKINRMCDSPLFRSVLHQSAFLCECSYSGSNGSALECPPDALHRPGSDLSSEERHFDNDTESPGSRRRRKSSYPYRFQLERDVEILQKQLKEEIELHAVLEHALEKTAVKLSNLACLPYQAQELLSNIAVLEVAVSKLEKEMISLHFQLSQERNERRLAEYRLRHSSSELKSLCFSNNLEEPDLIDSPGEFCSLHSEIQQDTPGPVHSLNENISRRTGIKSCQHEGELMKVPMEMPIKGLWDYPNKLSEEMIRCMKNIFISLANSASPCQSFTSQTSHLSLISPNGHLSNSSPSWWSSSDRSLISSWVQSPAVDVQSNLEVLAMENICDPYRVRGKLSWADVGSYGLAIEVSWMSVGKKQLEYAAGALRRFRLNFYSLDLQ